MIEPLLSLAFTVHSSPGMYALLLGSGISRSAHIPTGWEITLDLIHKLAEVEGEECEPAPEKWYKDKYGEDLDYSRLIDNIAHTPADRNGLLKSYFEPNEDEKLEGKKLMAQVKLK